jgi:hypothetical protein
VILICFFTSHQNPAPLAQSIDVISQGNYSSWDRSQAGIIVAKDKLIYDKMCKFINENSKKEKHKFPSFDERFVYVAAFAPETDYEPGWRLELNGVEQSGEDSLLVVIKATATDTKTSVKVSPRQPWILFKINIVDFKLTRHTRFQLLIRMIKTETIIPMEFK